MSRYTSIATMRADRRLRIQERFKDHRAELTVFTHEDGQERVEVISWRKPGTFIDSLSFMIRGAHLVVTGDLGDAIYTREHGWRFWANCDLDYFASKCVASDTGRLAREWDGQLAESSISHLLEATPEQLREEFDGEVDVDLPDDEDEADAERRRRIFRERHGMLVLDDEFSWVAWLRENGHDVFGDDYCEHGEIGRHVSYRCLYHLEGLKAAVAQLGASGVDLSTASRDTLDSLRRDVNAWQAETFPHATPASTAKHLVKEALELLDRPEDLEEAADVAFLLFANTRGRDLVGAIRAKLEKNKARTWGPPDADGVVEHVAEASHA